MTDSPNGFEGGCDCRFVRYRLTSKPLIVHCCHCRWCQRASGAAFALNAMIEADRVELTSGEPVLIDTPTASGRGQQVRRCPKCMVALWSHYSGAGDRIAFVRVGTLDNPDAFPPDVHIFTSTRQPWVQLAEGVRVFPEFYNIPDVWTPEALQRGGVLRGARA